jgi:hypothetical protein
MLDSGIFYEVVLNLRLKAKGKEYLENLSDSDLLKKDYVAYC